MLDNSVFESAFYTAIAEYFKEDRKVTVIHGEIDKERDFPVIGIVPGTSERADFTKELWQHTLPLYVDIYIRSDESDLYTSAIAYQKIIQQVISDELLEEMPGVFSVDLNSINSQDFNSEGVEYSSRTRLEWQIEYHTER